MAHPSSPVIIVGGGLAGLSAAHQAYLRGANVVLLDKQLFFGGNSTKATLGINGAPTRAQSALGIRDLAEEFYKDTAATAKDRANPALIRVLTHNSADAVHWLQDQFGLDLLVVLRLGGHSQPRTHRGEDLKFPGMAITYALMEKIEALAEEEPQRVELIKKARVVSFVQEGDKVTGVKYVVGDDEGAPQELRGVVIMATGGYAADFTPSSLLKKFRPDIFNLPSTNGAHATGDGQKLIVELGGGAIDMDKVQVHPTGLLPLTHPATKAKTAKAKLPRFLFLGAEALRGEGGIMVDARGRRFCDELGTRDYVLGEMTKVPGPIRLLLNSKAESRLLFHVKHYTHRGMMKAQTLDEVAKEMGVQRAVLAKQVSEYNRYADGSAKDPFGKRFFPNTPLDDGDTYHVAFVTRVLHFTMGGVKIAPGAEVMTEKDTVVEGLYAAGELAGGVHGHNRLGGLLLLGCVVFGRVAADSACALMMRRMLTGGGAAERLGQIRVHLEPGSAAGKVTVEWGEALGSGEPGKAVAPTTQLAKEPAVASAAAAPAAAPPVKQFKIPATEYTLEEVAAHNTKASCWVVVKNVVLDCTSFLLDHPGGEGLILNFAGKDATEVFAMLHEDRVIPKYAPGCVIGRVKGKTPQLEL